MPDKFYDNAKKYIPIIIACFLGGFSASVFMNSNAEKIEASVKKGVSEAILPRLEAIEKELKAKRELDNSQDKQLAVLTYRMDLGQNIVMWQKQATLPQSPKIETEKEEE